MFPDSDDEEVAAVCIYVYSKMKKCNVGKAANVDRNHELGHERLMGDYLNAVCTYSEAVLRRRYRLPKIIVQQLIEMIPKLDK